MKRKQKSKVITPGAPVPGQKGTGSPPLESRLRPGPGQKSAGPPLSVPGKEIRLDQSEKANTQTLNMKMGVTHNQIGFNRRQYLKYERKLMGDLDVMQNKMDTTIDMIKQKYKIVNQIKSIDFNKGIIYLQ